MGSAMEKATYRKLTNKFRLHVHREFGFRQRLLLWMAAEAWTDLIEIADDGGQETPGGSPASGKPTTPKAQQLHRW
jgi:hypothetical protein